ncbi:MAG TPA: hypothetical protein VIM42_09650 [Clostridium sp.]
MKRKKIKKIKSSLVASYVMVISFINAISVFATPDAVAAATVTSKVNQELIVIREVLTGIGVIAALKVMISKLPSLDDPHIKNEMWKSIGTIGLAVAVGGFLVWLIFYTIIGTSYATP